jgi:serine/threonine-protein kinase
MPRNREKGGMLPSTEVQQPARALSAAPSPGEVIATKYRVERVLGAGGMGVVVAAHHLQLETRVAIKFLLPGTLKDADAVARFAREARAAAKITNEHVARVFDVGALETGAPYIVMEFLDGVDLATRLRSQGPLDIEEAVEFLLQICEALAEAHALGIVHRDLKPANLFCFRRPDGLPWIKILDFGISKTLHTEGFSAQAAFTQSAAIMGSPRYMSPEQMQSARNVDARSDIWALGIVLYELLAGRPPFKAKRYPKSF